MAYTFPLGAAQFMDLLPIKEMTFELGSAVNIEETDGGEVLLSSLGTRLWQGEILLGDMTPDEADDALGMLDLLRTASGSFMCHDRARPWPRADWRGVAVAATTPTLHTVAANAREIRVAGLPPNYQLHRRDGLAFSYAENPTRFGFHRLAAPVLASAAGLTPLVEVVPAIRPGWTAAASLSFLKPSCKAVIIPGSIQMGRRKGLLTSGASFRWRQTLR